MKHCNNHFLIILGSLLSLGGIAHAQTVDPYTAEQAEQSQEESLPPAEARPAQTIESSDKGKEKHKEEGKELRPSDVPIGPPPPPEVTVAEAVLIGYGQAEQTVKLPFPRVKTSQLLSIPTAHLLPAAVIYSSASIDTGGSFGGALRVGLGDVGEFGLETSPLIRIVNVEGKNPRTIQPMVFATFKMGVSEDRLIKHQPALSIGFKKSFGRNVSGNELRAAAIEVMASKTFGKVMLHGGTVFWDAELKDRNDLSLALHDTGKGRQVRPFGGIEVEPVKNARIMVDLAWVPYFRPGATKEEERIGLKPALSLGIRSILSKRFSLESGVRIPSIGEFNLLDGQIFGQLTFTTDVIRQALKIK